MPSIVFSGRNNTVIDFQKINFQNCKESRVGWAHAFRAQQFNALTWQWLWIIPLAIPIWIPLPFYYREPKCWATIKLLPNLLYDYLRKAIDRLLQNLAEGKTDHDHFRSPEWAGSELTTSMLPSEKESGCKTVHHMKIYSWNEEGRMKQGV